MYKESRLELRKKEEKKEQRALLLVHTVIRTAASHHTLPIAVNTPRFHKTKK